MKKADPQNGRPGFSHHDDHRVPFLFVTSCPFYIPLFYLFALHLSSCAMVHAPMDNSRR